MKVSIAFMLVALSYCLSTSSSFYLPQMETMMSEEDVYFYTRMTDHLMCRYQEATECEEGPDRDFKMKCTLSDIFHIVTEMAEKLGCSMEEILCEMGVSDLTIEEMQDIISGEGSIDDLSSEECENFIISMLRGLIKMVLDLIRPFTGIVSGLLADGPLGGLLEAIPLDMVTGLLDSLPLDMVTGVLDSLPIDMVTGIAGDALGAVTGIAGEALGAASDILQDLPLGEVTGILEVATSVLEDVPIAGEALGAVTGILQDLPVGEVTGILEVATGVLEDVPIAGEALAVTFEVANSLMGNEGALGPMGDVVGIAQVSDTLTILEGDELIGGGTQVLDSLDIVSGVTEIDILGGVIQGTTGQLDTEALTSSLEITQVLTGSLDIAGGGVLMPGTNVEGITNVLSAANISPEGLAPSVGGLLGGGGLTGKISGGGTLGLGAKGLTGGHQKAGKKVHRKTGLFG